MQRHWRLGSFRPQQSPGNYGGTDIAGYSYRVRKNNWFFLGFTGSWRGASSANEGGGVERWDLARTGLIDGPQRRTHFGDNFEEEKDCERVFLVRDKKNIVRWEVQICRILSGVAWRDLNMIERYSWGRVLFDRKKLKVG